MMRIRQAVVADVPSLLPLVEEYWHFEGIRGFEPDAVAAPLSRLLANPRLGAGWLAWREGEAVGYLLVVLVFSLEHGGMTAEIDEFYLRPAWRGLGAGRSLLMAAEDTARLLGCRNISLQLGRGNDAAYRFYTRCGFSRRTGYELLEKELEDQRTDAAESTPA